MQLRERYGKWEMSLWCPKCWKPVDEYTVIINNGLCPLCGTKQSWLSSYETRPCRRRKLQRKWLWFWITIKDHMEYR